MKGEATQLQQCIFNCFVWADMNQQNRILAIKAKKRCCCYSVGQMCTLIHILKKLGLARLGKHHYYTYIHSLQIQFALRIIKTVIEAFIDSVKAGIQHFIWHLWHEARL